MNDSMGKAVLSVVGNALIIVGAVLLAFLAAIFDLAKKS